MSHEPHADDKQQTHEQQLQAALEGLEPFAPAEGHEEAYAADVKEILGVDSFYGPEMSKGIVEYAESLGTLLNGYVAEHVRQGGSTNPKKLRISHEELFALENLADTHGHSSLSSSIGIWLLQRNASPEVKALLERHYPTKAPRWWKKIGGVAWRSVQDLTRY